MDGSTALTKAKALATRSLSSSDRRRYMEHLLTLPAYHSQVLNEYYAAGITRDFTEFEEYQDQAVDAILDLCEDENEQTRISGIKALAEIGRVEPKWVRGNTGVLVQLLECPPSELRHVKTALFSLLETSPSDVFSMMAEDCKTSEEESGRNILNFLLKDAISQRKEILESGNYVEAERVFSEGFYDVLPTSSTKTILILELLGTLSTVSGRNSNRDSLGKYAKALSRSIPSTSSQSTAVIKLWGSFMEKAEVDPRWTIYFLAEYGDIVVKAAVGDDRVSKGILGFYNTQSQSRWRRIMEDRDERDLEIRTLIPKFAQTMVDAIVAYQHTTNIQILELVVHATYTILTISRDTRDAIPKSLTRKSVDFGDFANRKKKDTKNNTDEEGWRGVRDMADILVDPKMRVEEIPLTWSRSSNREIAKKEMPTAGRTSSSTHTQPRGNAQRPPTQSSLPSSQAPRTATLPKPIPQPPPAPSIIAKTEGPVSGSTPVLDSRPRSIAPPSKPSAPPATVEVIPGPQASTSNLSIRAKAVLPFNPPKSEDPVISHPPAPAQGLSIRSVSTSTTTATPKPEPKQPSLLSRLTPTTSASTSTPIITNKRSRAEDFAPSTPSNTEVPVHRSLADRLGGSDKRQRVASNPEVGGETPSLLSRMSQGQISHAPTSEGRSQLQPNSAQPNTGFTINRTGQPRPAPATTPVGGISIKRSGPTAPPPILSPISGFSIKNRSTSSASTPIQSAGFKIKRDVLEVAPTPEPIAMMEMEDDEPIVRKGRGFAAKQVGDEDIMITPPNPNPFMGFGGRLQDRIHISRQG